MGVNLADKGIFLEEIGALFTDTKINSFEFWRFMFEFWCHIYKFWRKVFEFWRQMFGFWNKFSKTTLLIGALFTEIDSFEFWRYMFEFWCHIFEFWRKLFDFWRQIFGFWSQNLKQPLFR